MSAINPPYFCHIHFWMVDFFGVIVEFNDDGNTAMTCARHQVTYLEIVRRCYLKKRFHSFHEPHISNYAQFIKSQNFWAVIERGLSRHIHVHSYRDIDPGGEGGRGVPLPPNCSCQMIVNSHVISLLTIARVSTCKYIVKITGAYADNTITPLPTLLILLTLIPILLLIHLTVCILLCSLAHKPFTLWQSRHRRTDPYRSYNTDHG